VKEAAQKLLGEVVGKGYLRFSNKPDEAQFDGFVESLVETGGESMSERERQRGLVATKIVHLAFDGRVQLVK
jgi:hypothetical protein